jgi:hypothetical protein
VRPEIQAQNDPQIVASSVPQQRLGGHWLGWALDPLFRAVGIMGWAMAVAAWLVRGLQSMRW